MGINHLARRCFLKKGGLGSVGRASCPLIGGSIPDRCSQHIVMSFGKTPNQEIAPDAALFVC